MTVSYIVLMLAMYPDYQQKVFEEIQSIFPDQTSDVSIAELTQLKYTDQFIKETMRLHPAVPYMSRKVHCDLKIGRLYQNDINLFIQIISQFCI